MTMASAQIQLQRQLEGLWEAVTELAVTVLEDQPADARTALVDDLADTVSDLQGDVHHALDRLRGSRSRLALAELLPDIGCTVDRARTRYWRDLRGYRPVAALRGAALAHGSDWRAWQRSVERAQGRIEEPLVRVDSALQAGVAEVSQLVALGLLPVERSEAPPDQRAGPPPGPLSPEPATGEPQRQTDTTHARRTP